MSHVSNLRMLMNIRFLYQGREVSYSSVLDRSISTRRQALYKAHGFDIEKWVDLTGEAKSLHKEIRIIAEDYDQRRHKEEEKEETKDNDAAEQEDVGDVEQAIRDDEAQSTSDTRRS